MFEKVQFLKIVPGKISPTVIKEAAIRPKTDLSKRSRANDRALHIFQQNLPANMDNSHSEPQIQTMKPPVSRCGPVCALPTGRVAPHTPPRE